MIKSHTLIRLEELGVLWQDSTGGWFMGYAENTDLTEKLLAAGMFEQ